MGEPQRPYHQVVREGARGQWITILQHLAPDLREACERVGHHVPCPVHGGKDGFRLFPDALESGGGICNTCGTFTNGFELLMWVMNWSFDEALNNVAGFLGQEPTRHRPSRSVTVIRPRKSAVDEIRRTSVPDDGTVATYLRGRGLSGRVPPNIKLVRALSYYEDGGHAGSYPAMVAPVEGLNGTILSYHRTYLATDGIGKAPVGSPKKLMEGGTIRGAAIHLGQPESELAITEGIETGLAVQEATGIPTWAAISATNMPLLDIPSAVKRVMVWADNDESQTGQTAAEKLADRLQKAGREVLVMTPDSPDTDWLDVLCHQGPEALQYALETAVPWELDEPPGELGDVRTPGFPLEIFPEVVRDWVSLQSQSIECPPDFLAVAALVATAATIGTTHAIHVKGDWIESPRMYAAIVGEPGSGKTPAIRAALAPLTGRQRVHDQHNQRILDANRPHGKQPANPKPADSLLPQLLINDTTVEALQVRLSENPRGMLGVMDELKGWIGGFNQYKGGRGSDQEFWLSLWSGMDYRVDRKGGPSFVLHSPFCNIIGGIQTDVLPSLQGKQNSGNGFIERILFTYPDPVRRLGTTDIDVTRVNTDYRLLFDRLWELSPLPRDGPTIHHLSPEAKKVWFERVGAHYQASDTPVYLRGLWSKAETYAARFALTLHLMRLAASGGQDNGIACSTIVDAWNLFSYIAAHTNRVHRCLHADEPTKTRERVIRWLKERGGKCTVRELTRSGIPGIRTADDARKLLNGLKGHWVKSQSSGRGRRTDVFVLFSPDS